MTRVQDYDLESLSIGMESSFEVTITDEMINAFQRITGDVSPRHVDRDFAIARGFSDRVVYGMLTASFYSTLVGVHLPGRNALLQSVDVNFSKPVFPNDHLTIRGEVAAITESVRQIEIKAEIVQPDRGRVSKAKIRVGIDRDD